MPTFDILPDNFQTEMKTLQATQAAELAGKTKLTAVTMGHGRQRRQFFVMLRHDNRGHAQLPTQLLNQTLDDMGCRMRGQTFTVG